MTDDQKLNIAVLGAGLVGFPIALDLSKDKNFSVTIYDIRKERLEWIQKKHGLNIYHADLSDTTEVRKILQKADFIVSAVPGYLGFQTLKLAIEEGKNVADIAFFPEDLFGTIKTAIDWIGSQNDVTKK